MNQRELRRKLETDLRASIKERRFFQRKPSTFALLQIHVGNGLVEAFGFAKVMYPDKWDAGRGRELAEQKAIAALAKVLLLEDANGQEA